MMAPGKLPTTVFSWSPTKKEWKTYVALCQPLGTHQSCLCHRWILLQHLLLMVVLLCAPSPLAVTDKNNDRSGKKMEYYEIVKNMILNRSTQILWAKIQFKSSNIYKGLDEWCTWTQIPVELYDQITWNSLWKILASVLPVVTVGPAISQENTLGRIHHIDLHDIQLYFSNPRVQGLPTIFRRFRFGLWAASGLALF